MEQLPKNYDNTTHETAWDHLADSTSPSPIIDVDHSHAASQEILATPEEYEKFAKKNFSRLLNALEDPNINRNNANEQTINAELAITTNLLGDDVGPDLFDVLENKYHNACDTYAATGQNHMLDLNQRLLNATHTVRNQFDAFITEQKPSDTIPADVIS